MLTVPVTRRHSSPVLSPIPDSSSNRMNLTRQTPKPLVPANATAKTYTRPNRPRKKFPRTRRRVGIVPHSFEIGQRKFIQDQHSKDKERRTNDELAKQKLKLKRVTMKEPTSELIKRIKSRPKGLMHKYRLKRKAGFLKKQAEEKRKHELSAKPNLLVQAELMVPLEKGQSFDKMRAQSA